MNERIYDKDVRAIVAAIVSAQAAAGLENLNSEAIMDSASKLALEMEKRRELKTLRDMHGAASRQSINPYAGWSWGNEGNRGLQGP